MTQDVLVQHLTGNLSDKLREATAPLHHQAERSGIISDLLHGRIQRRGLAVFLGNLLPVYQALETALDTHQNNRILHEIRDSALYRAPALQADLAMLGGAVPLLPEATAYAERVRQAACGEGAELLAFAYVRYMGDLSGGRVLNRLLSRTLGLSGLNFYHFADIPDMDLFRSNYRAAIGRAGALLVDVSAVVRTAVEAFQLDIALSNAVHHQCPLER